MKEVTRIDSPKLVRPVKPYYAPAVLVSGGKLLFISGKPPFDTAGNLVGKGDIGAQTEKVVENIKAVLDEVGGTLKDIVKVTVYVKEIRHFEQIAAVREKYFTGVNCTSTLIEVSKLYHPDMLIEIDAIAVID